MPSQMFFCYYCDWWHSFWLHEDGIWHHEPLDKDKQMCYNSSTEWRAPDSTDYKGNRLGSYRRG